MYLSERWLHNRYRGRDKGYCPTVWDMVVTSMPVNPLLLFSYQSHSLRQLEAYHKCFANKLEVWRLPPPPFLLSLAACPP
jgi:hypothetical protein